MVVGVALTAAMATLGTAMAGFGLAVKGATAAIGLGVKTASLSISWSKALVKSFSGLDLSLKNLGKTFEASIAAADQLQKRNLALGRDFQGFSKGFGRQIDKLPGVLSERLGTTMSMVEAGLRGNTLRTRQLTQTVRMSGGNFKQLSKDLATTQTDLALNNTALEQLSTATGQARMQYGVAAEQLVGAIGKLNTTVKRNAVLSDTGGPLSQAMVNLSGRLGGRAGGALARVAELMMSGGTFAEAHILGVGGARARGQGGNAAEMEAALLEIIQVGGARAAEIYARLGVETGLAGDAMGTISPHAADLKTVFEALNVEQSALVKAISKEADMHKQLSEIGKLIWEPIQEIWLDGANGLYQTLLDNAQKIQGAFTTFVAEPLKVIIEKFSKLFLNNEDFFEGMKSFFKTIAMGLAYVDEMLSKNFGEGGDSLYMKIVKVFGNLVAKVGGWFETMIFDLLPKMEMGFFSVIDGILQALEMVGVDIDQGAFDMVAQKRKEANENRLLRSLEGNANAVKDLKEAISFAEGGKMSEWKRRGETRMGKTAPLTGFHASDKELYEMLGYTEGNIPGFGKEGRWSTVQTDKGYAETLIKEGLIEAGGFGTASQIERAAESNVMSWATPARQGRGLVGGGDISSFKAFNDSVGLLAQISKKEWDLLQKGGIGILKDPYSGEEHRTKTSFWMDMAKWKDEMRTIESGIAVKMGQRLLEKLESGEESLPNIEENIQAFIQKLEKDAKMGESSRRDFIDNFNAKWDTVTGIKEDTGKMADDDEVPEILSNMVDEQAAMLSDSITAILMDAKQEQLLRVQLAHLEMLTGISNKTERQVALAEDAAHGVQNGSR